MGGGGEGAGERERERERERDYLLTLLVYESLLVMLL